MNRVVTAEHLARYFSITSEALVMAQKAVQQDVRAVDFLDMAQRYVKDAHYFAEQKQDAVLAFAALNYAHGWLDAGATAGFFVVSDNRLFTVDTKE